ncbi:hypothetical protein BDZ94DRAFT_520532 [Collybia nuda]|uniref:Uncharacterized protein n=1 Tax=Collybia nuda TaxID=64659 RepID=A0A9P5Y5V9_9AGAR|nr:hypothetical protein BDZ94DRAFT_520532 [Collybia nuda]
MSLNVMRTRGPNPLSLDDDLIDQILTSLPSFADLQSVVVSSNVFYGVFNVRPSSIVDAIAHNEIGPALPEALRACRYRATDPWPVDGGGLAPITCIEARSLSRNAAVVKGLEDVFSSRYKDRSSRTSKLNFTESWRFHRAMYTMSLFTAAFPGNELYRERDVSNIQRKQTERTAFLTRFPNDELLGIYFASRFLVRLLRWSVVAGQGTELWDRRAYSAWAASFSPNLIWSIYSKAEMLNDIGPDMEEASDNTLDSYIFPSISTILKQRGAEDDLQSVSILDENYRHQDKCQMCNTVRGRNLWNETSASRLCRVA